MGLLLQRVVTAVILVRFGVVELAANALSASTILHGIGSIAAIFLFLGLWTPIAGTVIAIAEIGIALNHVTDPWIPIALAVLGGTIAMIGPGAWSIDARLFGRKHIAP